MCYPNFTNCRSSSTAAFTFPSHFTSYSNTTHFTAKSNTLIPTEAYLPLPPSSAPIRNYLTYCLKH